MATASPSERPTPADDDAAPTYTRAIYGSILVTSLVAVQWRGQPSPDGIALTIVVSLGVFWLAHVWAEVVNLRVHNRFSRAEAGRIARDEAAMLTALVVPVAVLALGPRLGASIDVVVGAALAVCIGQLFVWGLVVGRAAHRGWLLPLVVALIDSALGILIVGLKVAVLH
jgi:hypothetical protein